MTTATEVKEILKDLFSAYSRLTIGVGIYSLEELNDSADIIAEEYDAYAETAGADLSLRAYLVEWLCRDDN